MYRPTSFFFVAVIILKVHQTCVLYTYTLLFLIWGKLLKKSPRPGLEPGTSGHEYCQRSNQLSYRGFLWTSQQSSPQTSQLANSATTEPTTIQVIISEEGRIHDLGKIMKLRIHRLGWDYPVPIRNNTPIN